MSAQRARRSEPWRALNAHLAGVRLVEPAEKREQRGLAAAACPDDAEAAVETHVHVHVIEHVVVAKPAAHVARGNARRPGDSPLTAGWHLMHRYEV